MVFAALVGGMVGARLDFIIQNYDEVSDDLLGNLFSGSGLVWYGGAIGGAIGVLLWARWRGCSTSALLDLCAPALAIGYAVGRIGCQLSGDGDYGIAWDGPWAMAYPDGTVATDVARPPDADLRDPRDGPGRATSSGACATASGPGFLFALYLIFAGVERFLVEFIRRNDDVPSGLTQAQLVSVAMIVAGGVWIARQGAARRAAGDPIRRRAARACPRPSAAARRRAGSRPGDVGGPLGAQERDQVAVLVRRRRDGRPGPRPRGLLRLLSTEPQLDGEPIGREAPGGDVVDGDPVGGDLASERLEEARPRPGRCDVRQRQPGDRLAGRARADVDDPSPAALAHPGQHRLDQHPRRQHQRPYAVSPLLERASSAGPAAVRRYW